MTNREILNGMSNWDLADFLYGISGTYPPSWENKKSSASYAQWEQWLRAESGFIIVDGQYHNKTELEEMAEFYNRCGYCVHLLKESDSFCDECQENKYNCYSIDKKCASCKHFGCDQTIRWKTPCFDCRERNYKNWEDKNNDTE